MSDAVLRTEGLTKRFGGLVAVDGVDLEFETGRVHAIIGPNGAGKTTFFNVVSGMHAADAGRVVFAGTVVDRGVLSYEDTVASVWPEFAQNGKQHVTIAQIAPSAWRNGRNIR